MPSLPQSGLYAIARLPGVRNVANANPCMGSFVGRNATTTHTKQVWSRFGKPLGNPANE
jgi:hypothetical protein